MLFLTFITESASADTEDNARNVCANIWSL